MMLLLIGRRRVRLELRVGQRGKGDIDRDETLGRPVV
jgi:hypothetical protein